MGYKELKGLVEKYYGLKLSRHKICCLGYYYKIVFWGNKRKKIYFNLEEVKEYCMCE